jgi:hypothetical protein
VQGIFRISGSAAKTAEFIASLNKGVSIVPEDTDPHVVANAIKQFVREVPGGLVPFSYYSALVALAGELVPPSISLTAYVSNLESVPTTSAASHLADLKSVVQNVPTPNLAILSAVCKFLVSMTDSSVVDLTKMDLQNIRYFPMHFSFILS